MSRSYGQYCGLARALDVVGDRWNLLIVRQLLLAPARYRELLDGLPGVATNLLSGRLRDLEAAGVLERRPADQGNAVVYALTPWGDQLREPIEGLIRWSTPLMEREVGRDHFRPEWLALALPALLRSRATSTRRAAVGMMIEDQLVQITSGPSGIEVGPHDGRELDATLRADVMVTLGLAAGALSLDDVLEVVGIDGDAAALRAVLGS